MLLLMVMMMMKMIKIGDVDDDDDLMVIIMMCMNDVLSLYNVITLWAYSLIYLSIRIGVLL